MIYTTQHFHRCEHLVGQDSDEDLHCWRAVRLLLLGTGSGGVLHTSCFWRTEELFFTLFSLKFRVTEGAGQSQMVSDFCSYMHGGAFRK